MRFSGERIRDLKTFIKIQKTMKESKAEELSDIDNRSLISNVEDF